ncbi:MAG: hypothetical protein ABJE47_19430 [bacterium]
MKDIDWPLAIELAVVFVVMSFVRWRWFRARSMRGRPVPPADKK